LNGEEKMNLTELINIASSEEKAEEFLRAKGVIKTFESCPFCGSITIGKVRRNFLSVTNAERNGMSGVIAY